MSHVFVVDIPTYAETVFITDGQLDRLSPATRDKLTDTLAAWLDNACSTGDIARALHVHMQTLRYRLRQLEEVFGPDALTDGERRLELQLALKVRREGA